MTLVEMLVVVALVVMMMTILVQVFQTSLGAMSASRTNQELDQNLRSIDSMIRSDLRGVTAKMTPPNDPALKAGYFEYGENAPADLQGEDTDDYLAFTTRATDGQVFTGRQWLAPPANKAIQPIAITSKVAEVIYFLRNGHLYRRVFLVAPERSRSIAVGTAGPAHGYSTSIFGASPQFVSWQGMNDISCRPNTFNASGQAILPPIPNDLGDLTNRENRAFRPRFVDDFSNAKAGVPNPDGIPDDNNADGITDYYPTLYYDGVGNPVYNKGTLVDWLPNRAMTCYRAFPAGKMRNATNPYDIYAFPFIYPGMYSVPEGASVSNGTVTPPVSNLGWRHGLFPGKDASGSPQCNHAALDVGDNLPAPTRSQTWWGFPTWRETMTFSATSGGWSDPIIRVNSNSSIKFTQPLGLRPIAPGLPYPTNSTNLLPPVPKNGPVAFASISDGAGSSTFIANPGAPGHVWEDDLILTNVRSFDVKAYDADAPLYNSPSGSNRLGAGYHDLGYGAADYLGGWIPDKYGSPQPPPFQPTVQSEPTGFGHEGRIPPIPNDFRHDPRRGSPIGDGRPGVIRLNRVFDTWSTDYTNAPDVDVFLDGYGTASPVYPAFPPPYPSPLRGIQIQIRVVDPRNERSRVLTIRHDFSDKLTN